MKTVKVSAAALNQIPLDWRGNAHRVSEACSAAQANGSTVLCLPELCLTGYGCEDAFHSPGVLDQALKTLVELAPSFRGILCNLGLPLRVGGAVYNVVAVLVDGEILGFVAKRNLAGDGIHYEPRWFKPWPEGVVTTVDLHGKSYPAGDLIFDIDGIRVGFEICEDAWVGDRPGISLAKQGADLLLNPSASHFAFGKYEIRERFVLEGSRAFGVAYLYANLLGCESGRAIFDGDTLISSQNSIVARGDRFSYRDFTIVSAVVDIDGNRIARYRQASYSPELPNRGNCVTVQGFSLLSPKTVHNQLSPSPPDTSQTWEDSKSKKCEEFWRAVSLGLFDYMRKSYNHGFVISLSGGVDSTAASCLIYLMVKSSLKEMGLSGIKKKLDYIPWISSVKNERDLIKSLLTCMYQGTTNSSDITRTAATEVAKTLGVTFYDITISEIVEAYERLIGGAIGMRLEWNTHDLAKQNIQARVRSPSVWLVANIKRALLLTTGNRSEAAVGYTTMDGDSSGGLSPLGGIDKAFLREWLVWLETEGPFGQNSSLPILKLVNDQQPTAELRPLADKQTDERDLMPYVVLDRIERYAVRDKKLPVEVFANIREEFREHYNAEDLRKWTERFFILWSSNQWKRERYAPSFHLDDENLDPKTWCRFPILSSGFGVELEELRKIDLKARPKKEKK
jgi:NAD+ synthase (glutamine-hydrolysing)